MTRSKSVAKQGGGRPSNLSLQRAQKDLNDRQLLFVAWKATPEKYRQPSLQQELAAEIGVSEMTLWRWSKDPRVLDAIRWMVLHHAGDPARVSDVVNFLSETAMDTSLRVRDRMEAAREYLKAVGVYYAFKSDPKLFKTVDVDEIDLSELSDDEVWELYNERAGSNGPPIAASEAARFDSRAIGTGEAPSDVSEGHTEANQDDS
jgi:hypothetical protein